MECKVFDLASEQRKDGALAFETSYQTFSKQKIRTKLSIFILFPSDNISHHLPSSLKFLLLFSFAFVSSTIVPGGSRTLYKPSKSPAWSAGAEEEEREFPPHIVGRVYGLLSSFSVLMLGPELYHSYSPKKAKQKHCWEASFGPALSFYFWS